MKNEWGKFRGSRAGRPMDAAMVPYGCPEAPAAEDACNKNLTQLNS